jgi:endonuclease-3
MSDPLQRTQSTRNSRVTLITTKTPPRDLVKPEPSSPLNAITDIEASIPPPILRRSARSTPIAKNDQLSATTLDVSSYSYAPVTPSPRKRAKIEHVDIKPDISIPFKSESKPPIGTPKSSAKKLPQLALEKPHKAPEKWEEQYRLIERMRKGIIAPVDDMCVLFYGLSSCANDTRGCERPRTTVDADPKVSSPALTSGIISSSPDTSLPHPDIAHALLPNQRPSHISSGHQPSSRTTRWSHRPITGRRIYRNRSRVYQQGGFLET